MAHEHKTDVIILGAGPAGYTAAIYAARASRKPILITGMQPGGQLVTTTDVENYPGFANVIQGPWLVEQMQAQAEHMGTRVIYDHIVEIVTDARPFRLIGDSGDHYLCDALIYATGAQAKWLGISSEEVFRGFGVSACATCDGFFFRDKRVAVVGGGNTAVEEALYLANIASSVTLVHRRDTLRAERVLQERLFAHPKIEVRWDSEVDSFVGRNDPAKIEAIALKNRLTGTIERLALDGVFVAIGHAPASALLEGKVELHADGYIKVQPGTTTTSVPGLFAAGDVADGVYRQAVTAAGLGCMAALEADRYLTVHAVPDFATSRQEANVA
ncbi:thioredoxin-disulfide reductase [Bradyrhizobium tropiciagri]|uniref:thioredoxin-disulfide reductase n=1 Tax=Bradyrhizobium tropiciagri TaxID=312253 RepID=UPI001BA9579D|nr:thioredoxin-disulfide reductase [Bradyrhizobium tropiciagri]MBR0870824.1 thioredoxin-disulfide reductase [Bradyrhizobium tropiciagri]